MEQTFLMIKPDAVQRGLVGDIIHRFETKGFKLVGLKMLQMDQKHAERHYAVHKGKSFYEGLLDFVTSGPVVAMVWEGPNVVAACRKLVGATNPDDAEPGTIRGDFCALMRKNIIHSSDAVDTAQTELANFFEPSELVEWDRNISAWIW